MPPWDQAIARLEKSVADARGIEDIESKGALEAFIKSRLPNLLPNIQALLGVQTHVPGDIQASGRSTAATGWLLCDGAAVSRTTYSALFAAIGTNYGAGDGTTTFNVPDLRGRVPVGKGTHADVNAFSDSDGLAVGSRTPKHTHSVSGTTAADSATNAGGTATGAGSGAAFALYGHTHGFSATSASGGAAYGVVSFFIKT